MVWRPTDMGDLVDILDLEREQLIPGEVLDYLMTEVISFDTSYGTDTETRIQNLIDEIKQLRTDNPVSNTFTGADRIERKKVDGEYEVEYMGEFSTRTAILGEIKSKTTEILKFLDPYRRLQKRKSQYTSKVLV